MSSFEAEPDPVLPQVIIFQFFKHIVEVFHNCQELFRLLPQHIYSAHLERTRFEVSFYPIPLYNLFHIYQNILL